MHLQCTKFLSVQILTVVLHKVLAPLYPFHPCKAAFSNQSSCLVLLVKVKQRQKNSD